ncbi:hypothetical protein [Sphingobacterium luzhongxinii]|uniref:hypothetical protein n=1 Tax=Sphingobacterium luzhongxinii TaxID=2654181 RepID=UPI0013DCE9A1|nr:hypothetical protein [Sphingobacterium sp. xlx-73]
MKRNSFLAVMFFVCATVLFASCSKDDDGPSGGSIDVAVGTYVGTIDMLDAMGTKYYDAVIKVSKVDNNHLKVEAKTGEAYSNITTKTLQVSANGNISVQASSDPNGILIYTLAEKNLKIVTKDTKKDDVLYSFEGRKQ